MSNDPVGREQRRANKRPAGDGSIRQRKDGMWRGEIMVRFRPDGKADRRYVYAKTQAECLSRLDTLKAKARTGTLISVELDRETVDSYLRPGHKSDAPSSGELVLHGGGGSCALGAAHGPAWHLPISGRNYDRASPNSLVGRSVILDLVIVGPIRTKPLSRAVSSWI